MRKLRFRYSVAVVPATALLAYVAVFARLPLPIITITVFLLAVPYVAASLYMISGSEPLVRRVIWGVCAFAFIWPYLLLAAAGASYTVNTWRLDRFASQFANNPPEGTAVALRTANVGVLTGNGNHCDYIVSVSIVGNVSEAAIEEHYRALPIRHAVPGESSELHLATERAADGSYLLTATDAPNNAAFDLRCI